MDILAHGLWTNTVFYKKYKNNKKNRYLAVLFGILPDIASFAPATLYLFIVGKNFSPELFNSSLWMFRWAENSYNFTHSLVIFIFTLIIITAIRKGRIYWPMFGWALHILIDILTHVDFYETPFLYPISNYHFSHGIQWAAPGFMIINYGLLVFIYLFWFLILKKRKNDTNAPN